MDLNKFLDFDRKKQVLYYNIYLNEDDIMIKIPLFYRSEKEKYLEKIKIEQFSLINYEYDFLLNCEQKLVF